MAKKGGVQQLQADINTDDEFEKFLERQGLLVLDVYSEWCGPCLGMVGSLKKIKLELGGDNLHLAVCKSDTISYLKRFNKKSEPTWLFVTRGKAVNLMFGTNVPKLIRMIAEELELLTSQEPRTFYEITELQPEEQERQKVKDEAKAEADRIELLDREKKRHEYLMSVTDIIMENLPDIGITVFGPQVNREMFKKIMEPADLLKIQCKDRRVLPVTMEQFATVNFACSNPLDIDVIEQMEKKELLICFWKVPEEQNIPEILNAFAKELTSTEMDSSRSNEDKNVPIIAPLDVEVEFELPDGNGNEDIKASCPSGPDVLCEYDEFDEKAEQIDSEQPLPGLDELQLELTIEAEEKTEVSAENETEVVTVQKEPVKRMGTKIVSIPPIWVPNDERTHAALIYVFFRTQTAAFLPPDPVPEPPHIVMTFDAYKKKDLIDIAERHKVDVPLYGFFTSDNPDGTKFIANSVAKYAEYPHATTDKLVFKVYKSTADAMLALAAYGPSYVSPNTVVGHSDALKFFPIGYKTAEQELLEAQQTAAQLSKKKRKSKKGAQVETEVEVSQTNLAIDVTEELSTQPVEECPTSSGEESAESGEGEEDDETPEQNLG